jgi:hypothetical protein
VTALAFFTVTGKLTAIIADYVDGDTDPDVQNVSCTIDFIPRLAQGQLLWAPGLSPKQGIALATIRARTDTDGVLKTIVGGTGVKLVANTDAIAADQLIYDLVFSNVVYNRQDQSISPRAFVAPFTGGITVDLADIEWIDPKPGLQ